MWASKPEIETEDSLLLNDTFDATTSRIFDLLEEYDRETAGTRSSRSRSERHSSDRKRMNPTLLALKCLPATIRSLLSSLFSMCFAASGTI